VRLLDTRNNSLLAPWGGSTFEFFAGNPIPGVSAAAINITGIDPWQEGFVTAYPAGVARPLASNLNMLNWGQIIANHAIVRVSSRGIALFTQNGVHLVADVAGWYLGASTVAALAPPVNPVYTPNRAKLVVIPPIDKWLPIETGPNLDTIANRGHAAAWGDAINVATPTNMMLFAHRTSKGGPFRYIDRIPAGAIFSVVGTDGHSYNYQVVRTDILAPSFNTINKVGLSVGAVTAQLIACHPPGSVTYRIVVTGRLVSVS
jgi:LPXTG-site transpeptidase (sortase) family protein